MHSLLFLCQAATSPSLGEPAFSWLFIKTVIAMVTVIVLAFVTLRYVLPRLSRVGGRRDSQIKILDYQPLENRKSIYILSIGGRRVAVGVTDQNINPLIELSDDRQPQFENDAVGNRGQSASGVFQEDKKNEGNS